MPRTEEERAGGFILVRYNGREWELPTLKREGERAWRRLLPDVLGPEAARLAANWTPETDPREAFGGANEAYIDALGKLIAAYDTSGVFGPDAAELDNLDSDQIRDLFGRLYEIANPLDPDLQKAMFSTAMAVLQQALELARLAGASSTSGFSASGDSTPTTSIAGSTASRSGSSGAGRRNEKRTNAATVSRRRTPLRATPGSRSR